MMNAIFKKVAASFFMGCMAASPLLADESTTCELSSSMAMLHSEHNGFVEQDQSLRRLVRLLFINQTVYFHDYTFAVLEGIPAAFAADDDSRLRQNALAIAQTLFPEDTAGSLQAANLLIAYISAGENFVNALSIARDFSDPVVQFLYNNWQLAGNQLAAQFSLINPRVIKLPTIQRLLTEYTILLASIANNLVPSATNTPDFTQASELYSDAKELVAERIAPLLTRGLLKSRGFL